MQGLWKLQILHFIKIIVISISTYSPLVILTRLRLRSRQAISWNLFCDPLKVWGLTTADTFFELLTMIPKPLIISLPFVWGWLNYVCIVKVTFLIIKRCLKFLSFASFAMQYREGNTTTLCQSTIDEPFRNLHEPTEGHFKY